MIKKIIKLLEKKGVLATFIGLLISLPENMYLLYLFFTGEEWTSVMRDQALVMNMIGMFWFILPSKIIIAWGANGKIEVID